MGQYKFWINIKWQIGVRVEWSKGESIIIDILCFQFGIGLMDGASGIGFW
jgi:hypothetical protein